jgi:CubicO group peptidase (beta-lactamase class C family)
VLIGQAGTGAAVAAWWDGAWVVDLWGGWADAAATRPWRSGSLVQPYSVAKPFAAICALVLVDRGQLELDAPVQRWWPQFTARTDVRQLLSHQAGVVALDEPVPTEAFYGWDWLCSLLAAQEPAWEPGTAHGESVLFYGHLIGELVRRADGRGPGRFLREEVCGPLGMDFFFGLTAAEQARAVDLTGVGSQHRGRLSVRLRDRDNGQPRPGHGGRERFPRMPGDAAPRRVSTCEGGITWSSSAAGHRGPSNKPATGPAGSHRTSSAASSPEARSCRRASVPSRAPAATWRATSTHQPPRYLADHARSPAWPAASAEFTMGSFHPRATAPDARR